MVNYDHANRECQIYSNRPRFCRVEPQVFEDMYGIQPDELNDFAIDCCRADFLSLACLEMLRFDQAVGL